MDLESMECTICLDTLADPRNLNCGHSFCMFTITLPDFSPHHCLIYTTLLLLSRSRRSDTHKSSFYIFTGKSCLLTYFSKSTKNAVECPECRSVTICINGIEGLPVNWTIRRALDSLSTSSLSISDRERPLMTNSAPLCEIHSAVAILFCKECVAIICSTCLADHLVHGTRLGPVEESVASFRTVLASVHDQANSVSSDVDKKLSILMHLKEEAETSIEEQINQVENSFARTIAELEYRKQTLLDNITSQANSVKEQIEKEFETLGASRSKIGSLSSQLRDLSASLSGTSSISPLQWTYLKEAEKSVKLNEQAQGNTIESLAESIKLPHLEFSSFDTPIRTLASSLASLNPTMVPLSTLNPKLGSSSSLNESYAATAPSAPSSSSPSSSMSPTKVALSSSQSSSLRSSRSARKCRFGRTCFDFSPAHRADFNHPISNASAADHPTEQVNQKLSASSSADADADAYDTKTQSTSPRSQQGHQSSRVTVCLYGAQCYRRSSLQHCAEYSHPPQYIPVSPSPNIGNSMSQENQGKPVDNRIWCKYDPICQQMGIEHRQKYQHTPEQRFSPIVLPPPPPVPPTTSPTPTSTPIITIAAASSSEFIPELSISKTTSSTFASYEQKSSLINTFISWSESKKWNVWKEESSIDPQLSSLAGLVDMSAPYFPGCAQNPNHMSTFFLIAGYGNTVEGKAYIIDLNDPPRLIASFAIPPVAVSCEALVVDDPSSFDNPSFVIVDSLRKVTVYSKEGSLKLELSLPAPICATSAFKGDLLLGTADGYITHQQLFGKQLKESWPAHNQPVISIACMSSSPTLSADIVLSASYDNTVQAHRLDNHRLEWVSNSPMAVTTILVREIEEAQQCMIACARQDGCIVLLSQDGATVDSWQAHKSNISAMLFTERFIISSGGAQDKGIHLWDWTGKHLSPQGGKHCGTIVGHTQGVFKLIPYAKGTKCASLSLDGKIILFETLHNGLIKGTIEHHTTMPRVFAISE
jgi:hypothetical protein